MTALNGQAVTSVTLGPDTEPQGMTPFKDKAAGELVTNFSFSGEAAISGMGE